MGRQGPARGASYGKGGGGVGFSVQCVGCVWCVVWHVVYKAGDEGGGVHSALALIQHNGNDSEAPQRNG